LALAADVAMAGTVEVVPVYYKPVHEADRVVFLAGAGEVNHVTMTQEGSVVVTRDRVPLAAGRGCEALADGAVRCTVTAGLTSSLRVSLGDGHDSARLEGGQWATLHGGPGNDHLAGLPDGSNTFQGGTGSDRMVGGSASDGFSAGASPDGADTMIGGSPEPGSAWPEYDSVNYERRGKGVRVDLDGDRDDGAVGEHDLVGADIEVVGGSKGDDVLTGGPASDRLDGHDGRDLITGRGGTDYLVGDHLVIDRSRSADRILGGTGDDVLTGGAGGDRLAGGPGDDTIYAGPGADRVRTRDDAADTVICGSGRDTLLLDSLDFPRPDCERLRAR
jgi:Ca2+-binding RTX toxin-like protein